MDGAVEKVRRGAAVGVPTPAGAEKAALVVGRVAVKVKEQAERDK